jgi:putative transposase
MKKSRYTEEQIAFALKQAETGTPVAEVIRRMGISEQTFYRCKKVYGSLGVGELRRLKQLEDENRQLNSWLPTSVWTSTSWRMSCQKSSDGWTTTRARRVRPSIPCRERTARLLRAGR